MTEYLFIAFVSVVAVVLLVRPWGPRDGDATGLSALETAFLAGGPERAADAVVVGYLLAGAAQAVSNRLRFDPSRPVSPELAAFRHLMSGEVRRKVLMRRLVPAMDRVAERLAQRGLVVPPSRRRGLVWAAFVVMAPAFAFGMLLLFGNGVPDDQVIFLFMGQVALFFTTLVLAGTRAWRTPAGNWVLASLRLARPRTGPSLHPETNVEEGMDDDLWFAFALDGSAELAGTDAAAYCDMMLLSSGGSDGGGDSGSCDSGGSDSGGGGSDSSSSSSDSSSSDSGSSDSGSSDSGGGSDSS